MDSNKGNGGIFRTKQEIIHYLWVDNPYTGASSTVKFKEIFLLDLGSACLYLLFVAFGTTGNSSVDRGLLLNLLLGFTLLCTANFLSFGLLIITKRQAKLRKPAIPIAVPIQQVLGNLAFFRISGVAYLSMAGLAVIGLQRVRPFAVEDYFLPACWFFLSAGMLMGLTGILLRPPKRFGIHPLQKWLWILFLLGMIAFPVWLFLHYYPWLARADFEDLLIGCLFMPFIFIILLSMGIFFITIVALILTGLRNSPYYGLGEKEGKSKVARLVKELDALAAAESSSTKQLPSICPRCELEGNAWTDDPSLAEAAFLICERCQQESSAVWCGYCGMGGDFVKDIEKRPMSWQCPGCSLDYDLPADFYQRPLTLVADPQFSK